MEAVLIDTDVFDGLSCTRELKDAVLDCFLYTVTHILWSQCFFL
jgi:hypothetical protein